MAEKKKKKNSGKIPENKAAKEGIEEIFATSPNKDKHDFVNEKPKKKKRKPKSEQSHKQEKAKPKKNVNKVEKTEPKKEEPVIVEPTMTKTEHESEKKETITIVAFLMVVIFGCIFFSTLNRINRKLDRIDDKLKEPATKVTYVNPKALFFGDSITDYWDLDRYFEEHHINKGISGNVTEDLLNRIEEDVIDYQPKKIFILIGTNDLARGEDNEYIVEQIEKMITIIQKESKNTKIYIESILPINNDKNEDKINLDMVGDRKNSDIQKINRLLKEVCAKKKVTYIDTYSEFVNEDGNLKLNYTNEGLHLSDEGYEKLANIIKKYL